MLRQTIVYLINNDSNDLKQPWMKLFFLFSALIFSSFLYAASPWRELTQGIEYTDLGTSLLTPWSHVHVFRIDLNHQQLDVITAKTLSEPHASSRAFARYSHALIAINGGFFDPHFQPLGLRISHEKQLNPLKRISWWGIFYVKDQIPHIASLNQYQNKTNIDFAVQSGPRLLIHGKIPSLKEGRAERSALGISPDGRVIILVTDNAPMSTRAVAELMRSPPLYCKEALNLDGGSSSQLYAHIKSFRLHVHGFSNVSDAILVKPR